MSTYKVTMTETTCREIQVEAENREEAEAKFRELYDKGFFNGPLEAVDDSASLSIDSVDQDDPELDGVPTYDEALDSLSFAKQREPFAMIAWNRSDIVHALEKNGIAATEPTVEDMVERLREALPGLSVKKGWDVIEAFIDLGSIERPHLYPPVSERTAALRTVQVYEDAAGELDMFVSEGDRLIYAHRYYESVEDLPRDIAAIESGEDPRAWDGNDLLELADPQQSQSYRLVYDAGRTFPDAMGVAAHRAFDHAEERDRTSLHELAKQLKETSPAMLLDPHAKERDAR